MEPQIQYARSADGTSIAFYEMGDGKPLIISSNIWNHLAMTWRGELKEASLELVRNGFHLVRYDMRGFGMSDRDVTDFSLDAQMADLEALREHLNLEQFALHGHVHASPACITYAARRPERLTHLLLTVPFARGQEWYRATPTLQGLESFRALGEHQWELYTLTHATALSAMTGSGDASGLAEVMRASAGPETLHRYYEALQNQDVTERLPDIRTPTLIFIPPNVPGTSLAVARGIPGARIVNRQRGDVGRGLAMPSTAEVPWVTQFVLGHESLSVSSIPEKRDPAIVQPQGTAAPDESGTAIILFADIVDSTALTERLGDAAFRDKARALDEAMRAAIRANGGTPVEGKTLGDGVLAVFTSAKQAIACAHACHDAASAGGLSLHAGIHAGDVIREADNVYGGAVNIAARVAAASAAAETLVSGTVRDLARTSAGVTFEDRGEHELKGVGEPVRMWSVRTQETEA
jgi:class 3 adenylate cyclase/pimeloyl-ACP methyl ester carboxylesterase